MTDDAGRVNSNNFSITKMLSCQISKLGTNQNSCQKNPYATNVQRKYNRSVIFINPGFQIISSIQNTQYLETTENLLEWIKLEAVDASNTGKKDSCSS